MLGRTQMSGMKTDQTANGQLIIFCALCIHCVWAGPHFWFYSYEIHRPKSAFILIYKTLRNPPIREVVSGVFYTPGHCTPSTQGHCTPSLRIGENIFKDRKMDFKNIIYELQKYLKKNEVRIVVGQTETRYPGTSLRVLLFICFIFF